MAKAYLILMLWAALSSCSKTLVLNNGDLVRARIRYGSEGPVCRDSIGNVIPSHYIDRVIKN